MSNNKDFSVFKFVLGAGVIAVSGYLAYNVTYNNVNFIISKNNAEDTYNERIAKFDDLRLNSDLSRYIFNKTGIKVEDDYYFDNYNTLLENTSDKDDLCNIVIDYIKGYFEKNNMSLNGELIGFSIDEDNNTYITYDGNCINLDSDAEFIFGNLIRSVDNIKNNITSLELDDAKKDVFKQVLVSETYEVVTINEKQLTLRPIEFEKNIFD